MTRTVCALSLVIVGLLACVSALAASVESSRAEIPDITYSVGDNGIEIQSMNTTTLISDAIPAASVRNGSPSNPTGDGFVLRSFVAYNASSGEGFSPDSIEFRSPTNMSVWTVLGPQMSTTSQGTVVTVELRAALDMVNIGSAGGPGGPGGWSPMIVHDWADATVRFTVSNFNYSTAYQGFSGSGTYRVNASSEIKFDVTLDILKPLGVDSVALELALQKMDDAMFSPSTLSGHYGFRGYQSGDMISESDPSVNETQGSALLAHDFENRNQIEQLIDFVNGTGVADGYFTWASQARIDSTGGSQLTNVSAYYRTDGESLTVYLSTPLTNNTLTVEHDPSVGVFVTAIHPVLLPETVPFGETILWVAFGAVVGVVAVGGAGAYLLSSRSSDQDPADSLDLGKNRYYRGKS